MSTFLGELGGLTLRYRKTIHYKAAAVCGVMSKIMKSYILLSIVSLISFGIAYSLPTNEVIAGVIATPGMLGLIAIIYQIFRDEAKHEKALFLQLNQQYFNVGAASHMANVVFDKHVEFCEKYMTEVLETIITLHREGPTKKAIDHGNNLYRLREDYAVWLTQEINDGLFPFEQALRSIGAGEHFINSTINVERYAKHRAERIEQVYEDFKSIIMLENEAGSNPEIAVHAVREKIRDILGVSELSKIRKNLVKEAVNAAAS